MKKFLLSATVVAFAATSAFAQTATEYYVVRDATTKKCTIVDFEANDDHYDRCRQWHLQDAN